MLIPVPGGVVGRLKRWGERGGGVIIIETNEIPEGPPEDMSKSPANGAGQS